MVSKVMNEANLLPIMRQVDKSLSVNDEKVKVVKDIFGSLNSFVSEKMKMLVLKIADGTVSPSFVRKNMDAVRSLNKDRNAVKAELKKEILAQKDEESVLLSLSNEEVLSSLISFPVRSDYMKKDTTMMMIMMMRMMSSMTIMMMKTIMMTKMTAMIMMTMIMMKTTTATM